MEHAEHFSAPMEMCMDDHLIQTTGRIQQQHPLGITHNILPDSNFSHAEFPPGIENTPSFLGKQFLQGKETITRPDMKNMPALLWNQSIQGNEKNVDTCTFIPGSTTLSKPSMLSIPIHPRRVPQNFQQLEKESSNIVALPGFNHNAETTTHVETSKNVHSNRTLSTSLKMDTNMNANMGTNHIAHRYRHTGKEPPALREVKHPHRDRTSMNRSPLTEQGVLSQFSSYSEEIEHFTRDPCTTQLKSCFLLSEPSEL